MDIEQDLDTRLDDVELALRSQQDRNKRFELIIKHLKEQQKQQMIWLVVLLTIQVCLFLLILTL